MCLLLIESPRKLLLQVFSSVVFLNIGFSRLLSCSRHSQKIFRNLKLKVEELVLSSSVTVLKYTLYSVLQRTVRSAFSLWVTRVIVLASF